MYSETTLNAMDADTLRDALYSIADTYLGNTEAMDDDVLTRMDQLINHAIERGWDQVLAEIEHILRNNAGDKANLFRDCVSAMANIQTIELTMASGTTIGLDVVPFAIPVFIADDNDAIRNQSKTLDSDDPLFTSIEQAIHDMGELESFAAEAKVFPYLYEISELAATPVGVRQMTTSMASALFTGQGDDAESMYQTKRDQGLFANLSENNGLSLGVFYIMGLAFSESDTPTFYEPLDSESDSAFEHRMERLLLSVENSVRTLLSHYLGVAEDSLDIMPPHNVIDALHGSVIGMQNLRMAAEILAARVNFEQSSGQPTQLHVGVSRTSDDVRIINFQVSTEGRDDLYANIHRSMMAFESEDEVKHHVETLVERGEAEDAVIPSLSSEPSGGSALTH